MFSRISRIHTLAIANNLLSKVGLLTAALLTASTAINTDLQFFRLAAEWQLLSQLWRIIYKFSIDEQTSESVEVARYLHRNRAQFKNNFAQDSTCVDWLFWLSVRGLATKLRSNVLTTMFAPPLAFTQPNARGIISPS